MDFHEFRAPRGFLKFIGELRDFSHFANVFFDHILKFIFLEELAFRWFKYDLCKFLDLYSVWGWMKIAYGAWRCVEVADIDWRCTVVPDGAWWCVVVPEGLWGWVEVPDGAMRCMVVADSDWWFMVVAEQEASNLSRAC